MTLAEAALQAFVRAAASAAIALPMAVALARTLSWTPRPRRWLITCAFIVLLPELAVGYAWGNLPWAPLHDRPLRDALQVVLVALRLTPLAALLIWAAPFAGMHAAAWHSARLLGARLPPLLRLRWWLRARAWPLLAAALLVVLLAFHDFELALRFGLPTWTVWLFDAQAGGLALSATLEAALLPWLVQALLLLAAWLMLGRSRPEPGALPPPRPWQRRLAVGYLLGAGAAILLMPAAVLVHGALGGLGAVLTRFALLAELGNSLIYAAAAACCAACLGQAIAALPRAWRLPAVALAVTPALLGSLSVGLCGLGMFGRPDRSGPLLLLAALVLLLLPAALIWALVVVPPRRRAADHALTLLRRDRARRALWWRLRGRRLLAGWSLLLLLALADLAASSLLAPIDDVPVLVQLHNLMHYGRSDALSGMLLLALLAPAALLALLHGLAELLWR